MILVTRILPNDVCVPAVINPTFIVWAEKYIDKVVVKMSEGPDIDVILEDYDKFLKVE